MLIKNILESAGYRVRTTVDGAEAFAVLQAEPFDLVVSDVEMPHLNGFELTAKIRGHSLLAETPVVWSLRLGRANIRNEAWKQEPTRILSRAISIRLTCSKSCDD
jgi:CheY-like chemotaxis protein